MRTLSRLAAGILVLVLLAAAALAAYRQFVLIPAMRAPLLAKMKDPESAQFRGDWYMGPWSIPLGQYCGEVNGRNEMGGYQGYRPFVVLGGQSAIVGRPGDPLDAACDTTTYPFGWWWLRK